MWKFARSALACQPIAAATIRAQAIQMPVWRTAAAAGSATGHRAASTSPMAAASTSPMAAASTSPMASSRKPGYQQMSPTVPASASAIGSKREKKGELLFEHAYMNDSIVPFADATLHVASSAVLYGLSVYTVFPVCVVKGGKLAAFRLDEHFRRLRESCSMLGIDTWAMGDDYGAFVRAVTELVEANHAAIECDVFVRCTVHLDQLIAGARTNGISSALSMFVYRAANVLPRDGARLKTVSWRRTPDTCIPSRAKVNGAYVNSALAKQEALSSGYDDAVFLDTNGHVCESSVANIFIVRRGVLITPDVSKDILEGINRRSLLEMAADMGIRCEERTIALTELYIADEVFCCGTSAYVSPVKSVDDRIIGDGTPGEITKRLLDVYSKTLHASNPKMAEYNTVVGYQAAEAEEPAPAPGVAEMYGN